MGAWLYIIECVDRSYYTGTTRGALETRIAEHQAGRFGGFTSTRRPVVLKYSEYFDRIVDAIVAEQRIKRWSRAKKEALIAGDFGRLSVLAKRRTSTGPHGSRRRASRGSSP
jgi:putative endonuclease